MEHAGHCAPSEAISDSTYLWQPAATGTDLYTAANSLNQYPSIKPQALGYDGKGNLTTGNINGDGSWTFAYDAANRMLTACKPNCTSPTIGATYAYDPLGRRVEKSGTGVTQTYYLSNGTDEIAEYNSGGTLTARYVPGPTIDEPIVMVTVSGGAKEYFHGNKQGSIIGMSDGSGARVEGPYLYDLYGNCFVGPNPCSSSGEPYRFSGRRFDAETGLSYYRGRYYWPIGGRFMQTDPVGYDADLDLYTYVNNDPTNKTDPTGLCKPDPLHCGSSLGDIEGVDETYSDQPVAPQRDLGSLSSPEPSSGRSIRQFVAAASRSGIGSGDSNGGQSSYGRQPDGSYIAPTGPGTELGEIEGGNPRSTVIGNGQCVTACKYYSGITAPTSQWRFGQAAANNPNLPKGTAIATMDPITHRYPTGEIKNSGIYMGPGSTPGSIRIVDQWPAYPGTPAHPPAVRQVEFNGRGASNSASAYYVIIVP